jgi:formate hydrogenlyase regulatory protein HycA
VTLPEVVPIAHEPGYHTDTIGRYADGQFYAAVHGAVRVGDDPYDRECLRWYAYVHRFDADGRYLRSDIEALGPAPFLRGELYERANLRLEELLDALPGLEYGDIAIRPFQLSFDGVLFGLIDESDGERGDWAELYPDGLGFGEPWDGEYDT